MCINPRLLANGVSVVCRYCFQCRADQVSDWEGRCIAESRSVPETSVVTLTYGGGDHERAAVLTYSDIQKLFKKLRSAKFPARYFAAGEYGKEKGRAHWHVVIFWLVKSPKHEVCRNFQWSFWDHGFTYWDDKFDASAIRYACKYIQKDMRDPERQRSVNMSKLPPLGAGYFDSLALRYVRQGLAPRSPHYRFADVLGHDGKPKRFRLWGKSLDLFISAYLRHWRDERGGEHPPSELVERYLDRVSGYMPDFRLDPPQRYGGGKPWLEPPLGYVVSFCEPSNSFFAAGPGPDLYWSFDLRGDRAWQSVLRTERQADDLRAACELRSASGTYRDQSRGR